MMVIDNKIEAREQDTISSLVQQNFSLTAEQAASLIALAEQQRKQATDYFQFTPLINKQYSPEQKVRLAGSSRYGKSHLSMAYWIGTKNIWYEK